jgi:hypothetical protein
MVAAAAALLVVGGAAIASGVGGGGGSSASPATSARSTTTTGATTAAATTTSAAPGTTATPPAPTATFDTSLPVGDPRRLPAPKPGELPGALLTGDGLCVPGLVDLAAPAPPERVALHVPGCVVGQSPSSRLLATSTNTDPEGQPWTAAEGASRTTAGRSPTRPRAGRWCASRSRSGATCRCSPRAAPGS